MKSLKEPCTLTDPDLPPIHSWILSSNFHSHYSRIDFTKVSTDFHFNKSRHNFLDLILFNLSAIFDPTENSLLQNSVFTELPGSHSLPWFSPCLPSLYISAWFAAFSSSPTSYLHIDIFQESVLDFPSLDFYYLVYSNDLQVSISSPNLSA